MKQMDKKERVEIRLQRQMARDNIIGSKSNAAITASKTTIADEIVGLKAGEEDEVYDKKWVDPAGVEFDQPLSASKGEFISIVSYNVLGPLHGESSKHSYADTKGMQVFIFHLANICIKAYSC